MITGAYFFIPNFIKRRSRNGFPFPTHWGTHSTLSDWLPAPGGPISDRVPSSFGFRRSFVRLFIFFFVLFFEIRGRNKNRRSRWVGRPNFIGRRSLDGVAPVCGASRARRADSRCAFVRFLRYVAPSMFVHPFVRPFANSDALPDAQPARFRRHFVFRSRFRFFLFLLFFRDTFEFPFPTIFL